MTSSSPLRPQVVALAWSLWAELGVSGWARHHQSWLIDPETLVVFTAWLGDTDARLRDEATDWCVRFGSWLSASRLTNLLVGTTAETYAGYGELAATVGAHSTLRWRGATTARPFKPTGRSRLESLRAPSLLALRLRAILGVGARAEIVRIMLAAPQASHAASDLVDDAGFKKRNVADALDALRLGGVLDAERLRNQIRYHLHDPAAWSRLVGELPDVWARWTRILPALAALTDGAERCHGLPMKVRTVELNKLLREISPSFQAAELLAPPVADHGGQLGERFDEWAQRIVGDLARGKADIPRARAV